MVKVEELGDIDNFGLMVPQTMQIGKILVSGLKLGDILYAFMHLKMKTNFVKKKMDDGIGWWRWGSNPFHYFGEFFVGSGPPTTPPL